MALSTIPHANAQLKRVEAGGFSEDFNRPATADTAKWTGDVGVYLGEKVHTETSAEGITEIKQSRARIPTALVAVKFEPEDVLVLTQGAGEFKRKVLDVRVHDIVGVTVLELERG